MSQQKSYVLEKKVEDVAENSADENSDDEFDEERNDYYGSPEFEDHLAAMTRQRRRTSQYISEKQRKASDAPQRYNIVSFAKPQVSSSNIW